MERSIIIEDRGQPNPRQADVDRTRDAATRAMQAMQSTLAVQTRAARGTAAIPDDVPFTRPGRASTGSSSATDAPAPPP